MKMGSFAKKLDWNLLKNFAAICEANGVSRAAERLGRKQPAVSQALKRLEDQLGVSLCHRGPGGFELTREGERIANQTRFLLEKIEAFRPGNKDLSNELTGVIRLGIVNNLVCTQLDDSIVSFHHNFPSIELNVEVMPWEAIVSALLQGKIDVGIAPNKLKIDSITSKPLFSENYQLYCGRLHRLYGVTIDDPAELRNESFILTGNEEPDRIAGYRREHGLGARSTGSTPHLDEARRLAALGVGLCFLPKALAEPDVVNDRLWPILRLTDSLLLEIYLLTNQTTPDNLQKKLFLGEIAAAEVGPAAAAGGSGT